MAKGTMLMAAGDVANTIVTHAVRNIVRAEGLDAAGVDVVVVNGPTIGGRTIIPDGTAGGWHLSLQPGDPRFIQTQIDHRPAVVRARQGLYTGTELVRSDALLLAVDDSADPVGGFGGEPLASATSAALAGPYFREALTPIVERTLAKVPPGRTGQSISIASIVGSTGLAHQPYLRKYEREVAGGETSRIIEVVILPMAFWDPTNLLAVKAAAAVSAIRRRIAEEAAGEGPELTLVVGNPPPGQRTADAREGVLSTMGELIAFMARESDILYPEYVNLGATMNQLPPERRFCVPGFGRAGTNPAVFTDLFAYEATEDVYRRCAPSKLSSADAARVEPLADALLAGPGLAGRLRGLATTPDDVRLPQFRPSTTGASHGAVLAGVDPSGNPVVPRMPDLVDELAPRGLLTSVIPAEIINDATSRMEGFLGDREAGQGGLEGALGQVEGAIVDTAKVVLFERLVERCDSDEEPRTLDQDPAIGLVCMLAAVSGANSADAAAERVERERLAYADLVQKVPTATRRPDESLRRGLRSARLESFSRLLSGSLRSGPGSGVSSWLKARRGLSGGSSGRSLTRSTSGWPSAVVKRRRQPARCPAPARRSSTRSSGRSTSSCPRAPRPAMPCDSGWRPTKRPRTWAGAPCASSATAPAAGSPSLSGRPRSRGSHQSPALPRRRTSSSSPREASRGGSAPAWPSACGISASPTSWPSTFEPGPRSAGAT